MLAAVSKPWFAFSVSQYIGTGMSGDLSNFQGEIWIYLCLWGLSWWSLLVVVARPIQAPRAGRRPFTPPWAQLSRSCAKLWGRMGGRWGREPF